MTDCIFVSDLHGDVERCRKLICAIEDGRPAAVFIGGDSLPWLSAGTSAMPSEDGSAVERLLGSGLLELRDRMRASYPRIFIIMGNDDARSFEPLLIEAEKRGLWQYVQERRVTLGAYSVYGYSYVPPTPFLLKDWERYDVSRFVDPGSVSPEEGTHTVPVPPQVLRYSTIKADLATLAGEGDLSLAVFLFHAPPYKTDLDRAALDGKKVDGVPLDVHVGSIAIRRFIEERQPLITLHGHVHESARITGSWRGRIGRTHVFSAAHDGPELALVEFALENPEGATRRLV